MTVARDFRVETLDEPAEPSPSLASWYAQGVSDELGDRLLMFDNTGGPSLELLRFRRSLTAVPGFEDAVRSRVERLSRFHHPAFADVRGVEYLGPGEGLALVSNHTPGKRLSEVLQQARGPAFAVSLIRQLTPALAALQQYDSGIGHGALTANRIIVGPDSKLVIVEHVLGTALDQLQLSATRLHTELGISVPTTDAAVRPRLDSRTDSFQLGLIALSLLVGRTLMPHEYPHGLSQLLADWPGADSTQDMRLVSWLRIWLQRALQLNGQLFDSSADALNAFRDMSESGQRALLVRGGLVGSTSETILTPEPSLAPPPPSTPADTQATGVSAQVLAKSAAQDRNSRQDQNDGRRDQAAKRIARRPAPSAGAERDRSLSAGASTQSETVLVPSNRRREVAVRAAFAALVLLVVGQALIIASLLNRPAAVPAAAILVDTPDAGSKVIVDGRAAGVTPFSLQIDSTTRSIRVVSSVPPVANSESNPPQDGRHPSPKTIVDSSGGVLPIAAAPQRSGGIRLVSPFPLDVFEGDRRLVSAATGIVSVSAGRRTLELVNDGLGFRTRRTVNVRAGQLVSVDVSPPNGRVNINAVPWAQVWLDGKSLGETPVGNVSVPPGEHEILFRHPELGERRQTAVVRLDGVTRVSVNLER